MAPFNVRRASERDQSALERLCAEATGPRSGLWSARRAGLDPAAWLAARAPLLVAEFEGSVVAFGAALVEHAPLGVARCAEAMVHVTPALRRRGAGRALMTELVAVVRTVGLWKLIAYALPEDVAARTLLDRADFREVGVLVKHAQLEGTWRDVALHERLVLAARKSLPSIPGA